MLVAACVKWVDPNPTIDPLRGTVHEGGLGSGFSDADRAAVESALRIAASRGGTVEVVCVGPEAADPGLRELLAAGVDQARRVAIAGEHGSEEPTSAQVAALLASLWSTTRPDLVVCGDVSVDRGSGAVPAFLAHELGVAQALGLLELQMGDGGLEAVRRLDGGRRERLEVAFPAVVSVEGSVSVDGTPAVLRRASLSATLATRAAPVEVHVARLDDPAEPPRLRPWRPRPRVLPAPEGDRALDRIVSLTGALVDRTPPRTVTLDPEPAAGAILDQLRDWGYLPPAD